MVQYIVFLYGSPIQAAVIKWLLLIKYTINEAHLQCIYPTLTPSLARQCMFTKVNSFYIHRIKRNTETTRQSQINYSLIAYVGTGSHYPLPLYLDYHSWKSCTNVIIIRVCYIPPDMLTYSKPPDMLTYGKPQDMLTYGKHTIMHYYK
jgi:hypothetical protein